MGRSGLRILHLQYADDTLVFCKYSTSQLKLLIEAVFGLKVKLSKSCIYGVGQVDDLWRSVARMPNGIPSNIVSRATFRGPL